MNVVLLIQCVNAHVPIGKGVAGKRSGVAAFADGSTINAITVAGGNGLGNAIDQILPGGIFVDASGNLYVADAVNNRVQKFAPSTVVGTNVAGGNGPGSAANQLYTPSGIAVDQAGNLYVGDANNSRVQKWAPGATSGTMIIGGRSSSDIFVDAGGNVYVAEGFNVRKFAPGVTEGGEIVAGGGASGSSAYLLDNATGVFVDAAGNIYIADMFNNRVQKWAPGAGFGVTVAGGNGAGSAPNQLWNPRDVFVDAAGNVFVSDEINDRIQKWAPGATEGVTVAGGNGKGRAANQLDAPRSIFVDASGAIYVGDASNYRVQKFLNPDALSKGNTVVGGNGQGAAANQLNEPNNVFIDKTGNIYVADLNNNRIQKFAPGSSVGVTVAGGNGQGSAANQLSHPTDVRLDDAGNMYVADYLNHRIQKFAPGSSSGVTVAGGNGPGFNDNQLNFPAGVFVDKLGNIFVADYQNNRIQKWPPGAIKGNTIAGGFGVGSAPNQVGLPNDVFVDDAGNIFVADQNNDRIQKWAPGLPYGVTVAGGNGSGNGADQLRFPTGVYVDKSGAIYIADFGNQRVQKWVPGATSGITIAGGNGTGAADNQLNGPVNVALDANNNLFVSDAYNNRIQKFAASGLAYRYYEGSFGTLPPFNMIAATKSGSSPNVDLNVRTQGVNTNYAILWEGSIKIPTAGSYTFETISDDGSKLYFNSLYSYGATALVNSDGLHAAQSVSATVTIPAAGVYPIAISFFQASGDQTIQVYWTGPGIPRQRIPDAAFASGSTPDNIAPDAPANLHVVTAGGSFITLDWDNSNDNIGVAAYDVYVNGVKKYSTIESQITVDSLSQNTSYTFSVKARDLAGNTSGFSNTASGTTSGTLNGLHYKYYEGTWNLLPDFSTLTPAKTGTSLNVDISVRPSGRNDNFAFVWEGYINILTPGLYTFETVSDDGSRLYFNSMYVPTATATVNNDGLHAPTSVSGNVFITAPGVYPISITFFEKDGGEQMQVYWTVPGGTRQLIPNSAFTQVPPQATSGLNYRYYEGSWTQLPEFNSLIPVKTGNTPNVDISIRPAGVNDNFAFVWEGYINIPAPGNYTFETLSDDGSRIYFNSFYSAEALPLVYNDGVHAPNSSSGSKYIAEAGKYPIAITFFEKDGGEVMQVFWSGPGFSRQLIPNSAFVSGPLLTTATSAARSIGSLTNTESSSITKISKMYPDPFVNSFNIEFYNAAPNNDVSVQINDMQGRKVYQRRAGRLPEGKQLLDISLDYAHLADGMYLVTLYVNGVAGKPVTLMKKGKN